MVLVGYHQCRNNGRQIYSSGRKVRRESKVVDVRGGENVDVRSQRVDYMPQEKEPNESKGSVNSGAT